jgi:hypothetical protein
MAGEMFVAAELAKRGYSIALTMGNAKAVDLFAEKNGKSICIQVKAIRYKKYVGWPIPEKEKILDGVIYVCVILNDLDEQPTYYVVPPHEVRERGKWYATRAILNVGKLRAGNFQDAWHTIEEAFA